MICIRLNGAMFHLWKAIKGLGLVLQLFLDLWLVSNQDIGVCFSLLRVIYMTWACIFCLVIV